MYSCILQLDVMNVTLFACVSGLGFYGEVHVCVCV